MSTILDCDDTVILRQPLVRPVGLPVGGGATTSVTTAAPTRVVLTPLSPAQRERIAFFDLPSSPFCAKVRAMLLWKGLAFDALEPLRAGHWLALRRRGAGKLPALAVGCRLITDSTDIAVELDRLAPARPLLPASGRAAALCHAATGWADESIEGVGLRFQGLYQRKTPRMPAVLGRGPLGRGMARLVRSIFARPESGPLRGRRTPLQIEQDLRRHLAHASALLADAPFMLGDEPWLCDFALYGQLAFMLQAPASRERVEQYPRLVDFVKRMRGLGRA